MSWQTLKNEMNMKLRNLTLPEFAFLEGWEGDSELDDRYVVLHVRTMSLVEIIEEVLKPVAEWFCRYLDWEEGNVLLDKR